jgi:PAS domain S-box-containing protein
MSASTAGAVISEMKPVDGRWEQLISRSDSLLFRRILDHLPAAIYTTDQVGRITYYNQAAVALWGRRPELGEEWCGSWKLYYPDGSPLPHDHCPMAIAIKEERSVRGAEALAERPDGSRVPFIPYPTPLFSEAGKLIGAVNVLVDISDRKRAEELTQRLAAIVASSQDAIISKDLLGKVTSWNEGAERLFGYTADEMIGQPITILIPAERYDEEPAILARICRGERVDPYDTVRQRKDGSMIDVSLTVSPIKDANGRVVGASKIAHDITERRRSQKQKQLLLEEMDHRVKNLFALATGLVNLSANYASSPAELAAAVSGRLGALARAQTLLLSPKGHANVSRATTLHDLIRAALAPFEGGVESGTRIRISGSNTTLGEGAVINLALLLHELATNAAKYGALSTPSGSIGIRSTLEAGRLVFVWTESGAARLRPVKQRDGFGSLLIQRTIREQLEGKVEHLWEPGGLEVHVSIPCDRLGHPRT